VIEAAFDRALADIAEKGVTQSEFDDIKQRFLARVSTTKTTRHHAAKPSAA
jgi:hypothetical protein